MTAAGPLVRWLARRTTANRISVARALLAVPVLIALGAGGPPVVGGGLYTLAWLTDVVDGRVARERRRRGFADDADRGELIDTVADKLLLVPVLVAIAVAPPGRWGDSLVAAAVLAAVALAEGWLLGKRVVDYAGGRRAYRPMVLGKVKVWMHAFGLGALVVASLGAGAAFADVGLGLMVLSLPLVVLSIHAKLRP